MKVNSFAVSLNVQDVAASSRSLQQHFGFRETLAADGFASLARDDASMNVVFLRRDLPTLPEDQRDIHAIGLILAFSVDDLDYPVAEHGPLTVGVEHDVAVLAAQLLRGAGGLSQMGQQDLVRLVDQARLQPDAQAVLPGDPRCLGQPGHVRADRLTIVQCRSPRTTTDPAGHQQGARDTRGGVEPNNVPTS